MMGWFGTNMARKLSHYILVYALILLTWWLLMSAGLSATWMVALVAFPIFVFGDMVVHKLMRV